MEALAFDLGRVLFDFDYNLALKKIEEKIRIPKEEIIQVLFYEGFAEDFERGKVSSYDFYLKFKEKTGLALDYQEFVPIWCDIFILKEETLSLIENLKPLYRIFLISNINELHYNFLKERYPYVFSLFEKEVLSFKVGFTKPSPQIYDYLLKEAGLSKEDLVYIDDREDLIEEAKSQGFISIRFKDIEQCREELNRLGCFIPSLEERRGLERLRDFLMEENSALLGLGNSLRKDDSLGIELCRVLKNRITLKVFEGGVAPENLSLRSFREFGRLVVLDATPNISENFKVLDLEEVFSLAPFSTHTSLIFFHFLKKELNLDIIFLLVKAESFEFKEGLSSGVDRRKKVVENFFLLNFSKKGGSR